MKGSIYCGSEWVFPYLYSCHPLAFLEIVRLDGSSTEWSYNSKQQPRSFFLGGIILGVSTYEIYRLSSLFKAFANLSLSFRLTVGEANRSKKCNGSMSPRSLQSITSTLPFPSVAKERAMPAKENLVSKLWRNYIDELLWFFAF